MSDKRTNRDDFSAPVKRRLEQQAGSRCCNPGCNQPTRAQSWDGTKPISIGTAAHICAAAKGGARYDPDMSPGHRASAENGIWMCRNCGTLIDTDEAGFPVEEIKKWKAQAIAERRNELVSPARRLHAPPTTVSKGPADEADIRRYTEFVEELPSDGPVMTWLREWDGGSPYLRERTEALETFVRRWTAPERAFNRARVQAALITLTKSIRLLLNQVYINTFPLDTNIDFSRVPSDWHHEKRERWDEAVEAHAAHMDAAVTAHVEFVRMAKEELGT